MRVIEEFLELLRSEGVTHVFGNPGSTELGLMDSLVDAPDLEYVLALQEATAIGMAEGYAQATGRPAFVNLHTAAGLGNAIGNLTNAMANRTPLVVTAGQQDSRHLVADPFIGGDLVSIARPVVKWAHEVRAPGELGAIMRRAFLDAASPPRGPVFVSLPMDLFESTEEVHLPPLSTLDRRCSAGGLQALAELLSDVPVGRVAIVVGDEVVSSGATDAVVALAEVLGSDVFGSPLYGGSVFPPLHALWRGMLPAAAEVIAKRLGAYQRVLMIGERPFMAYPYTAGPSLPADVELLQLSSDPHQLGRSFGVRLGVLGDVAASLQALLPLARARMDVGEAARALDRARERRDAEFVSLEQTALGRYGPAPMHPMAAAHALVRAMPPGTPVVDEAITTGLYVRGFHHADRYFFSRGGGLGWGMPVAVGVSLARGALPVLCVVGDGSAMYSPQALWSAARHELPVLFAVVNNRQYLVLKRKLWEMHGASAREDRAIGMDLDRPAVDFSSLAASMGVPSTVVGHADEVRDAVETALSRGGPHLLELPIAVP